MARHAKTVRLIERAHAILAGLRPNPMTVRQVYYQLVSGHGLENTRGQYKAVSNALVKARKEGIIPWEWIEDRLRRPRSVDMWTGLPDFAETCKRAYRLDVWETQPGYVEAWLEKDALSGIFEDTLDAYGVTLNVGRGYDGWDSIRNAAERYSDRPDVAVLYFGDFDPSGEDMARSLSERLRFFGCEPEIVKCALVFEDIERYDLPPAFAKRTDTRAAGFIARHGDVSVELDALPVTVLRERLVDEVEARMDLDALAEVQDRKQEDRGTLVSVLSDL